jgi:predicted Zn-dependent protease
MITLRQIFSGISALLLTAVLTYTGCSSGINIFTTQDDIKLGQQVKAEIAKNPQQYPVLNNESVRSYVQNIANTIKGSSLIKYKVFPYDVTIIKDDKTVNAFCIPGGSIYVYTGLLKYIDDEATLAGIMGHEITHADHRHSTQQMTKQYGVQTVAAIILGDNSSAIAQVAANISANLVFLKFSRDDETDADNNSFALLNSLAGKPWYPSAMGSFMKKTLDARGKTSELEKFFLTHPPSEERLANLEALAKKANLPPPDENTLKKVQYQKFRATLP